LVQLFATIATLIVAFIDCVELDVYAGDPGIVSKANPDSFPRAGFARAICLRHGAFAELSAQKS
jgi:hypothetical protein